MTSGERKLKALELKIPPPVVGLALAGLMWWLARVTFLPEVSRVLRLVPAVTLSTIGVAIAVAGVLAFHRAQKRMVLPLAAGACRSACSRYNTRFG